MAADAARKHHGFQRATALWRVQGRALAFLFYRKPAMSIAHRPTGPAPTVPVSPRPGLCHRSAGGEPAAVAADWQAALLGTICQSASTVATPSAVRPAG